MKWKQHVLIILFYVLVALTGYSQNGAVFNPLQPVVLKVPNGDQAYFFESPTYTATGTVDGARNRNRNFPDNNTTIIYNDPTITATGTLLTTKWIGSGKTSGGNARETAEFLLKQNTVYLLRFTEPNVAATHLNWELDWYEHTNKE